MDTIRIKELPYEEPEPADNIIIENLEDPESRTSRTRLDSIKRRFTGKLNKDSDGFATGKDVHDALQEITGSLNNISAWNQRMSDLFTIPLRDFIDLKYDCCLVSSLVPDYPETLKHTGEDAYLFTNRNARHGVQLLIGASTGFLLTRRLNNGIITSWTAPQGKVFFTPRGNWSPEEQYERFDIVEYEGSSFIVLKEICGIIPADDKVNYVLNAGIGKQGDKGEKGDTGDKGETGNSGVFIGPEPPDDPEIKVWIDTSDSEVFEIVNELGDSASKAVSQKLLTDSLKSVSAGTAFWQNKS